jgi:hypothetical protein
MTREEAISLLSQVNHILVNSNSWLENTHEPLNIAFDMAIEALEQEPCEDAVSRKAVFEAFEEWVNSREDWNEHPVWFARNLVSLPPVTPQHTDAEIQKMQEMEQAEIEKAYNMGVSEKETVLGKMRTEIERHRRKTQGIDPYDLVGDCLEIIDKYNAESEEQE